MKQAEIVERLDRLNPTQLVAIPDQRPELLELARAVIPALTAGERTLTLWQKDCLQGAVAALSRRMYSEAWVSLRKALIPPDEISPTYPHNAERTAVIAPLTAEALQEAIEQAAFDLGYPLPLT